MPPELAGGGRSTRRGTGGCRPPDTPSSCSSGPLLASRGDDLLMSERPRGHRTVQAQCRPRFKTARVCSACSGMGENQVDRVVLFAAQRRLEVGVPALDVELAAEFVEDRLVRDRPAHVLHVRVVPVDGHEGSRRSAARPAPPAVAVGCHGAFSITSRSPAGVPPRWPRGRWAGAPGRW